MIYILAAVFFLLLLIVGGDRGAVSLITLVGNMLVFLAAVVAMAARIHPILVTVAGSVAVNCITILYQNGTGKKSISALLSVGAVMLALLVFVFWIGGKMHIGGLNEIDMKSDLSLYYSFNIHGGYADGMHIHDYHRATGSGDGFGGCHFLLHL